MIDDGPKGALAREFLTRYMVEELGVPGYIAKQIGFDFERCTCSDSSCLGVKAVFRGAKHITSSIGGTKVEDVPKKSLAVLEGGKAKG